MTRTAARLLAAVALFLGAAFASQAHAAVPRTAVTIVVNACGGCSLTAIHPFNGGATAWSQQRTIRNGRATFSVPRAYTRGLYFVIGRPPGAVISDGAGARVAVTRYPRFSPGTRITAAQAAHSSRGYHCWAGTSRATKTMALRVVRFRATDAYTGREGFDIAAFFSPTRASVGHASPTGPHGTLGAQDFFAC